METQNQEGGQCGATGLRLSTPVHVRSNENRKQRKNSHIRACECLPVSAAPAIQANENKEATGREEIKVSERGDRGPDPG